MKINFWSVANKGLASKAALVALFVALSSSSLASGGPVASSSECFEAQVEGLTLTVRVAFIKGGKVYNDLWFPETGRWREAYDTAIVEASFLNLFQPVACPISERQGNGG